MELHGKNQRAKLCCDPIDDDAVRSDPSDRVAWSPFPKPCSCIKRKLIEVIAQSAYVTGLLVFVLLWITTIRQEMCGVFYALTATTVWLAGIVTLILYIVWQITSLLNVVAG